MKEKNLLYQIRTLEKLVFREFICSENANFPILTPTQMQIVEYMLKHNEENVYQKDLETILNLRRATVSGVLQTMEKNGYIERVVDTEDSRIKKILLNPSAEHIFYEQGKKLEEIETLMTKDISEEELLQFLCILKKMKENLKLVTKKEGKELC